MKMTATTGAAPLDAYAAYVHNCLRNPACEPPWAAPLPGVPYLQLYVDFGPYKPVTYELWLQDACDVDHTEQLFASNYIVGKDPEGNWYGVFKYVTHPLVPVTTFVAWLSVQVDAPGGLLEKTFFSELLQVEPCLPLTKIKACYPEGATDTGFDLLGVYYGLPVTGDFLGFTGIRYFHIAYTRLTRARELPPKATFTSNLIRTFRSSVDRSWSLETELVPKWYYLELLAIYMRGALSLDDGPTYLVSDVNAEAINDDDLTWKPFATLKQTTRLFFGCDTSVCVECCSPRVLSATSTVCCSPTVVDATAEVVEESASASASASTSASASAGFDPDAQAFIDAVGTLTGPQQGYVDFLVHSLKAASLWDKMLAVYPMIGGTAAAHKWNLKDPRDLDAAYRLTFVGTWTHDAQGIHPDGVTAYANTHLDPSATALTNDDGSMGVYIENNTGMGVDMGYYDGVAIATQLAANIAAVLYGNWGSSTFPNTVAGDPRGFTTVNRVGGPNTQAYKDGATAFDTPDALTSLAGSVEFYLGARHDMAGPTNFSDHIYAFAYVGHGLTPTEQTNLYNTVQAFQTALGRQV